MKEGKERGGKGWVTSKNLGNPNHGKKRMESSEKKYKRGGAKKNKTVPTGKIKKKKLGFVPRVEKKGRGETQAKAGQKRPIHAKKSMHNGSLWSGSGPPPVCQLIQRKKNKRREKRTGWNDKEGIQTTETPGSKLTRRGCGGYGEDQKDC